MGEAKYTIGQRVKVQSYLQMSRSGCARTGCSRSGTVEFVLVLVKRTVDKWLQDAAALVYWKGHGCGARKGCGGMHAYDLLSVRQSKQEAQRQQPGR